MSGVLQRLVQVPMVHAMSSKVKSYVPEPSRLTRSAPSTRRMPSYYRRVASSKQRQYKSLPDTLFGSVPSVLRTALDGIYGETGGEKEK